MIRKFFIFFFVVLLGVYSLRADTSTLIVHDGPRTVTWTVNTQIIKPSNNPSYSGNASYGDYIQDVHVVFSGPVDGNEYTYSGPGGSVTLGMPYDSGNLHYAFPTDAYFHSRSPFYIGTGATYPTLSVSGFSNATITNPTPTGANPASITLNVPQGSVPNYIMNSNGTVSLAIVQNGVTVQTLTVPGSSVYTDSVNNTVTFSNLTDNTDPAKIAVVAHGYVQSPSGLTYTGNQSDGAFVYVPITQGNSTSTSYIPNGTGSPTLNFSPNLFVNLPPNPTSATGGAIAGSQAQPLWVSPASYTSNYTNANDTLSNEVYKQGVAQQMAQDDKEWETSVGYLGQIANNTANAGSLTINGTLNVRDADAISAIVNNTLAVNNGTAALNGLGLLNVTNVQNASAAPTNGSLVAYWAGLANSAASSMTSALTPATALPTVPSDPGTGSSDNLTLPLPLAMGGAYASSVDVNPFHYGATETVVAWLKWLFTWFLAIRIVCFAWTELAEITRTLMGMDGLKSNQDAVHGGSAGQLVNAAIFVTAVIAAGALFCAFLDGELSTHAIVGWLTETPWSGMPAIILYFASKFFPLAMITYYALMRIFFAWKYIAAAILVKAAMLFAAA